MSESIYVRPPQDRHEAASRLVDLFSQLLRCVRFGEEMRGAAKTYAAELLLLIEGEMKRETPR